MQKIPLRNKAGDVVAWALVDDEDYHDIANHRWYRNTSGYAKRNIWDGENRRYRSEFLHRRIMNMESGDRRPCDHINGDPMDNTRANLRIVTALENAQNLSRWGKNGASGRRNVYWCAKTQSWFVKVKCHGRSYSGGRMFKDVEEASRVATAMRVELFPHSYEALEMVA